LKRPDPRAAAAFPNGRRNMRDRYPYQIDTRAQAMAMIVEDLYSHPRRLNPNQRFTWLARNLHVSPWGA
jgi:hypothetical protein